MEKVTERETSEPRDTPGCTVTNTEKVTDSEGKVGGEGGSPFGPVTFRAACVCVPGLTRHSRGKKKERKEKQKKKSPSALDHNCPMFEQTCRLPNFIALSLFLESSCASTDRKG